MKIQTQFGKLNVARRFGPSGVYVETTAPDHRWFCLNLSGHWVAVPEASRALLHARAFQP